MANIPVERTERTGGFPWWGWLLGLLLLIGLIWLLSSAFRGDDRQRVATAPADTAFVDRQDDDVLTDPVALANAPNPRVYEGREVRFENMRVEVPYSDSVFYAVPDTDRVDRRFFVVLGDPGRFGPTGATNLNVGDRVSVHGRLMEPDRSALQRWEIAEDERARLDRYEDYYIRATRVTGGGMAPGTTAPGTTAPGATAPGATPGTTAPGTTAPGTTAPGTTTPGTTPPPP